MLKNLPFLILFIFSAFTINAQIITVDPPFPLADEAVTVTLNTLNTGLEDYTGDVYAHTGITVDGQRWQYVIAEWGENIPKAKLTNVGNHLYQLNITPTIRGFYEAVATDDITELCFVFRSADGTQQTSPDIFYPVYQAGIGIQITLPDMRPVITEIDDTVHVEGNTTEADSTFLYVDGQQVYAGTGNSFVYDIVVENTGKTWVKAVAKNATESVADSFYYFVRPPLVVEDPPEGIIEGINYINDQTVILSLYAPEKEFVFAIGDFSNWELEDEYYMKQSVDGTRYWIEINNLEPGREYIYQYFIDGNIRVGDIYADKVSDPWNDKWITEVTYPNMLAYPEGKTTGIATVFQTAQTDYNWQTVNFTPPEITDMVVYELLVRDFTRDHTFTTLKDTLDYLQRLGVNVIEIMPFSEFEGNSSWGYNPNYYFAPDKYYGPKNTVKEFIDECHRMGFAVVMDMVLNHAYNTCPLVMMYWDAENNRPAANNPWFNTVSPNPVFSWGSDFNHESQDTKNFIDRVNRYWMEEYKVDGFRFDFTKGFTNTPGDGSGYDQSRIDILTRMANVIWDYKPDAFVILEHFAANSEEKVLSDNGMLLWGNSNYNYNEATMGYNDSGNSDFSWISYQKRGWDDPHVVGYMESHDEERLMFKNITYGNSSGDYDIKDTITALQREALAANFFFTIPGPKMIWQFGERGYDYSIEYNGRVGEKPPRWDYMDNWRRKRLYYIYASLIDLKKDLDVFKTDDFELDVRWALKKIKLTTPEMSAVVLGNFHVSEAEIDPDFYFTGTWYEYWSGDSIEVTDVNEPILLQAGEYRLYTDKKLTTPGYVGVSESMIPDDGFKLEIYPNPASSELNLVIEKMDNGITKAMIIDMTGKKVKDFNRLIPTNGTGHYQMNVEGIRPGLYFLKVETENGSFVRKLMIKS